MMVLVAEGVMPHVEALSTFYVCVVTFDPCGIVATYSYRGPLGYVDHKPFKGRLVLKSPSQPRYLPKTIITVTIVQQPILGNCGPQTITTVPNMHSLSLHI